MRAFFVVKYPINDISRCFLYGKKGKKSNGKSNKKE